MDFLLLLKDIEAHIKELAAHAEVPVLEYHNMHHTQYVVNAAIKISNYYKLNDGDFFTVVAAAWFHDVGYYFGPAAGHEAQGAELAVAFLERKGVDPKLVATIKDCILATKIPQQPNGLLEQIVCDADLFHLGTEQFSASDKLMRKERESASGQKISKDEWRKESVRFLMAHQYHTQYAKEHLEKQQQKHLEKLKIKVAEHIAETTPSLRDQLAPVAYDVLPTALKEKKTKDDRPERGIETMFRISSGNHQRLSDMADNKAHILITTTSIIISVLLSLLLRKLEDNPYLTFPTVLMLAVCAVAMVFSILATRPSIPTGVFTPEALAEKRVNLLFFGNFYRMNFESFDEGMNGMMNDREFLYGSLKRDLYSQGVVLGKKYRLLRVAYNVFMFGIIASIISFSVATIFFR